MRWIQFEWDRKKASVNKRKHGISFEEAQTAFYDENAILIEDKAHSIDEDRFILLGMSLNPRLLVISHCYRKKEEVVRIISARKASKNETGQYNGRLT